MKGYSYLSSVTVVVLLVTSCLAVKLKSVSFQGRHYSTGS